MNQTNLYSQVRMMTLALLLALVCRYSILDFWKLIQTSCVLSINASSSQKDKTTVFQSQLLQAVTRTIFNVKDAAPLLCSSHPPMNRFVGTEVTDEILRLWRHVAVRLHVGTLRSSLTNAHVAVGVCQLAVQCYSSMRHRLNLWVD